MEKYDFTAQDVILRILTDNVFRDDFVALIMQAYEFIRTLKDSKMS